MVTRSKFVILFQVAFILIFTLGMLFPAGMVAYAQDGGTTSPGTEEVATPDEGSSGGGETGGGEAEPPASPPAEPPASPPAEAVVTEAASDGAAAEGSAAPEAAATADPVVETPAAPAAAEPACVEGAVDEVTGEPVACGAPIVAPAEVAEEPADEVLDTPAEVLAALPAETELVVTGVDGEPLPLVSVEAEEVLVEGDPMWCPGNDVPSDGTCIHTMTLEGAIMIASAPGNGNSTIYVAADYHRYTTSPIVISSPFITDLVIVGGVTNMFTGEATSQTSLSQAFVISNIAGSVSLSNFILTTGFYGDPNPTISINNSRIVNLDNMNINNKGKGDAVKATNSFMVTITDSKIKDSDGGYGINAEKLAFLVIKNTSVLEKGKEGGILLKKVMNTYMDGVNVVSEDSGCSTKNPCEIDGISAVDSGNIFMKHVTATSEWGNGFKSDGGGGYITLIDSVFNRNMHGHGVLIVDSHHNVYLDKVTADFNGEEGVEIKTPGIVTIKDSHMDWNRGDYGLEVLAGGINVSGSTANGNKNNGAYLESNRWINILNSYFSYNMSGYGLEASAKGDINIKGSEFNHNGWWFIEGGPEPRVMLDGGDDVERKPVVSDRYGAHLYSGSDIRITDTIFNYNYNEGLYAQAGIYRDGPDGQEEELKAYGKPSLPKPKGSIFLDGVEANFNGYPFPWAIWPGKGEAFGAKLVTDGKLIILNSEFNHNRNYGVNGEAGGFTRVAGTDVFGNGSPMIEGTYGAMFHTLSAFVVKDSNFNWNWGPGLQVYAKWHITADNVSASNNADHRGTPGYGALFDTMFGGVDISDSEFDNNDGFGLFVFANRDVEINNTTANNNSFSPFLMFGGGEVLTTSTLKGGGGYPPMPLYDLKWANGDGAFIKSLHGSITINDSSFNDNWAFGLVGNARHDINLNFVEAIGNGIGGAVLKAGGNISSVCSTFSENGVFGLHAVANPWHSTITLDSNTIENNGWFDKFTWAHEVIENNETECYPEPPVTPGGGGGPEIIHPFIVNPFAAGLIPVTGGEFVPLSCDGISTIELLPGREATIFNQPMCGYMASMELVKDTDLPAPIPEPWKYVDGFTVTLMFNNEVVTQLPAGATDTLVFPLSPDQINNEFIMLFWDVTANGGLGDWVALGGAREALKWTKTHNMTGTFLLVK